MTRGDLEERLQLNRIIGQCNGAIKAWEQVSSGGIAVEGMVDIFIDIRHVVEGLLNREHAAKRDVVIFETEENPYSEIHDTEEG